MTKEKVKMSTGRKVLIGLIVVFVVLALAVYVGGIFFFKTHFLPGSKINGVDCSFKTEKQTQEYMREKVSVYTLAINERDEGREKLEAEEIGLTYEPDDSIGEILKKQNTAAWVLSLPKGKSYQWILVSPMTRRSFRRY